jgi:hypothetical protein
LKGAHDPVQLTKEKAMIRGMIHRLNKIGRYYGRTLIKKNWSDEKLKATIKCED